MRPMSPRAVAYNAALTEARRLMAATNPAAAMPLLGRAHVLGQREIGPHLRVHLPLGNTGASNVNPFEPVALPPELERLLRDEER